MSESKPLVWMHGEIKTPPFGEAARLEAGFLLRKLQLGETVPMPHSRLMPSIDPRCHELRVNDANQTWRIVYSIEDDAIVILEVFSKKSRATPKRVVNASIERLKAYRSL
jgi:phage-related protein